MKKGFALALMLMLVAPLAAAARAQNGGLKLPPYKRLKLKNGLTVLLMEQREVPIVNFSLLLRAGSIADPAGKEGLASVTAALLRRGTKTRTADQISAEIDFVGGQLSASATHDAASVNAEFLRKDIAKGVELLADVLLNPTFPQEEVTKLLRQRIDGIRAAKDQAQGVIGTYFSAYLYGDHPYARPTGGTETSLAAITRDDIMRFYQTNYAPGGGVLAVAGDFDAAEMERQLTEKLGAWPARDVPMVKIKEPAPFTGKKLLLVDKPDATQTFFQIGNLGITRVNPDRVYIDVVNTLFGARFTSMLNSELRIQTGLTYGARSFFDERRMAGPFVISTYTRNAATQEAIDRTLAILRRLHEKGITEAELQSAKTYIKGQFPPSIETSGALASLIAELEFFGLDEREINELYAKIDAMTVADANRIIKQYYPLDNLVFVLIGKRDEIEKVAARYAPKVDVKSITDPGF